MKATNNEKRQQVTEYKNRRKKHRKIMLYIAFGFLAMLAVPAVRENQDVTMAVGTLALIFLMFVKAYTRELDKCPFCGEHYGEFAVGVPDVCPHCKEYLDYKE